MNLVIQGEEVETPDLKELHRIAHVIEVPVCDQEQVAAVDGVGGLRAVRVAEPRIDEDRLAAGRPDLDA